MVSDVHVTCFMSSIIGSCPLLLPAVIPPGWGMMPDPSRPGAFVAADCRARNSNAYGVATKTYGLQGSYCKPCQRGLVLAQNIFNSTLAGVAYSDCVNPAGFGYSPDVGGSQCPAGFWAAAASMKPCIKCPAGRVTTVSSPATEQDDVSKCFVAPGSGLYDPSDKVSPWDMDAAQLASVAVTDANITVLECPRGYWGAGGSPTAVNSLCQQCPVGSTTPFTGSVAATSCSCELLDHSHGLFACDLLCCCLQIAEVIESSDASCSGFCSSVCHCADHFDTEHDAANHFSVHRDADVHCLLLCSVHHWL